MATRGHVDKGTWGQGVVSPLCGVALFQVGIALRAILEASKVGAWLRRALLCLGGQGGALPLPASGGRERQLGWHAVPTLPEAIRTARGAVPTRDISYPRQGTTRSGGTRGVDNI